MVFKFKKSSPSSTVSLKNTFSVAKDSRLQHSQEQLKLWFPFNYGTLYLRVKNDNYKLHLDNGLHSTKDYIYNLYGSVQGKRQAGDESLKGGL